MKKISMILFAAAMAFSFVACGGKTENKDEAATTETATEEVKTEEPAAAASDADQFLANYEKFLNDMLPVMEKVATGDAAAVQDYQKYAEQANQLTQDAQKYAPNFTPEQAQKWQDMNTKYAEAVQKMSVKK